MDISTGNRKINQITGNHQQKYTFSVNFSAWRILQCMPQNTEVQKTKERGLHVWPAACIVQSNMKSKHKVICSMISCFNCRGCCCSWVARRLSTVFTKSRSLHRVHFVAVVNRRQIMWDCTALNGCVLILISVYFESF